MVWLVAFLIVLPFAVVLLFGAPYLPTRSDTAELALDMLKLKKGQHLVDLGSGDGAVLVAAARRGIYSTGYELNPIVFGVAYIRCFKYRKYITLKLQNFWNIPMLKNTDAVFVFLLDKYMKKLDHKFKKELQTGTKVVSYTFVIPGQKIVQQKQALNLYIY